MSFASLPLLTSLLGGTTMRGSTNWERRVFVSCGPHFVLWMFVPELDTHWSPALQPACTPDTHSQSSSAVSLFSSLPAKQCGNTCTQAAVGETLLGLKVKSLLFTQPWSSSLYSRIPPHSSPTLHRGNCSELPSGSPLQPVWQFSLQPLIHWSKEILSQKIGTFLYYYNSSIGKKTNEK